MTEKIKSWWRKLPMWIKAALLVFVITLASILGGGTLKPKEPPVIEPPTPPTGATTVESVELWVDGYDNSKTGWNRYGNSPYLDAQDQPTNMINSTVDEDLIGDFSFQDLPSTATSIINVTFWTYTLSKFTLSRIYFYVWNGSDWIEVSGVYSVNSWGWDSENITDILDTVDKVNNAKIYIRADGSWLSSYPVHVDAVKLEVWYEYSPPNPQASNISFDNTILARDTKFSVKWTDDAGLSGYIFSWNASGSWENDTWISWTGNPLKAWSNVTKELPPKYSYMIGWRIYANDTDGNWGDTGIQILKTSKLDYSETAIAQLKDAEIDLNNPSFWVQVLTDQEFKSATADWVAKSFSSEIGKWIKIADIQSEEPYGYLWGYEVEVYDSDVGQWISPSSVYDVKGGSYLSRFIDGDTSTFWEYQGIGWIIVELDQPRKLSQIRIWCAGNDQSNWTGVDIYIGKSMEWDYEGNPPFLNASDYPNNYIFTTESNRRSCNFTFNYINFATFLDVKLVINYTSTYSFYVEMWDGIKWRNATDSFPSAGDWTVANITLDRHDRGTVTIWTPTSFKNLKIRFRTGSLANVKIDFAYIWVRGYRNQTKMLEWLFDSAILRKLPDKPLIKQYSERLQEWTGKAGGQLLFAVSLYKLTGNTAMLNYAYEYVNWLQSQPIDRLFQTYDWQNDEWIEPIAAGSSATRLLGLAMFCTVDSNYLSLLDEAVSRWINLFIVNETSMIPAAKVYLNGTHVIDKIPCSRQGRIAAALAYAGYVLNNQTVLEYANKMILNWAISDVWLPATSMYPNGTAQFTTIKEDEHFGYHLLGAETVYYFTSNDSLKERIRKLAWAGAQYYWTTNTFPRFVYEINSSDGSVVTDISVHGFGLIDEALIQAYLIWGNETWVSRAYQDFYSLAVEGRMLVNDLIVHACAKDTQPGESDFDDVSDVWNAAAKRVALIFYCLNYSQTYQNSELLDTFNKLYGGTSAAHYKVLGWANPLNATDFSPCYIYRTEPTDIGFATLFRNFINITDKTINTFRELYAFFGNPFTGEIGASNPLYSNLQGTFSDSNISFKCKWWDIDGLDTATLYWNVTGSFQANSTISFSGVTEGWSNWTRTKPSGLEKIYWFISCNDTLGNVRNTTIQVVYIYTELVVGWNNFTAWSVDVGKTLSQVNTSLHLDNINWTVISLEYSNGSRAVLVWEQDTNEYIGQENAVVESGCTFYIYCKEAGEWYHSYP